MDPGPPEGKRPRLSSWPASTTPASSLPHPHVASAPHQHPHPPPPPPPPHHPQHHPAPSPYQQPYPPRSAEVTSVPPPPPPAPIHGHAQHPPPSQHSDLDRRHHEQETLAPMQDHYRQPQPHQQQQQQQQPPSPAHPPPYHTYSSRDSAIKREVGEDSRRPNSTGHAPEPLPSTAHVGSAPQSHAPPQPVAYQAEAQARHMSYDNGSSVPPGSGVYRTPSFPPTPSHQSSYESHGGYPATEAFYSVYSSVSSAKKKNTRASQACDQCRQLKAKCDETKPCKTCRDKGTECRYRDPVPKATDKAQADILEGITVMQNSLARLADHVGHINDRMIKLESAFFERFPGSGHVKTDPMLDDETKAVRSHTPLAGGPPDDHYYANNASRDQIVTSTDRLPMRMMAEDEIEPDPGPPIPPGEPAIPMNHTTLAGLLLNWPSIREMTKHHVEKEGIQHITEFPISQEQNRGVLIVHGRGEDSHSSRAARELPDHGQLDMADDSSDMASPSPAADWGHIGGHSPSDQVDYRNSVLGFDGNPDFTESKVWTYVESFKENILNMHPIIRPKVLDEWVHHFLNSLPRTQLKSSKPQPSKTFAVVPGIQPSAEVLSSKRKRSPEIDGYNGPSTPGTVRAGKPERSIHNALILTILALGKICLHRENVPDALHHGDPLPHGSPLNRNGIPPSPMQGSPPSYSSHSHTSSLASPKEPDRGYQSRRSSIHTPGVLRVGYNLKKNYDVIPGLEYFAFATDILGNHTGAYKNMKTVYANIFAGLYQGQLARPVESFAFIHQANHKLQAIMRPSLGKLKKIKDSNELIQDPKYNQLALTFWTCLQLESDLIAELQLPPSGLLAYEDDMPHPNMSLLEGVDQRILDSYPGQLYLRTHLNSIHRMFYAPENDADGDKRDKHKFGSVGVVAEGLSGMFWVARRYAFKEDDPPAGDILSARLRGKYWGAQVITYRPFIRMILEFNYSRKNHPSSPNVPATEFREGLVYPKIAPGAKCSKDLDPELILLARRGIRALIESTRAFHGLGDKRPIITNVFGTAHAQWGNLLVLAAAYKDPTLHSSVDEELLQKLFQKTIQFLRQSATATSSLRIDMHILEGLQRDLFQFHDPITNSSFSSSASLNTPKMLMGAPPPVQPLTSDPGFLPAMSPQAHTSYPHGR